MPTKILMICGDACVKCKFLEPHLKEYAEKNNIEFVEKDVKEATKEELGDATMLPVIRRDWERIEFDEALARLS